MKKVFAILFAVAMISLFMMSCSDDSVSPSNGSIFSKNYPDNLMPLEIGNE